MDTDQATLQPTTNPGPLDPPPLYPAPETTPELPLGKQKTTSPIIPVLFGVVVVVIVSSVLAGLYYFAKLKKEVASVTPSPSPTLVATPTPEPSSSASASASPNTSAKPSAKASSKPTSTTTPNPSTSSSPTPTPVTSNATLDLRFGNPSAHVKQTYDDGSGDGRVINREFSSIQTGEFDELVSSWAVKVTSCFHVVSNQDLEGSKVGYSLREDDKILIEGTLSQYSKVEAGKIYDVCHDVSTSIGAHKLELTINNAKSLGEASYANNTARLDYKNLADNIAPNFVLIGPNNEGNDGTCLFPQYISDNVSVFAKLKIEQQVDNGAFSTFNNNRYCFKGNTGDTHTYLIRITDERGNKSEQSTTFKLF